MPMVLLAVMTHTRLMMECYCEALLTNLVTNNEVGIISNSMICPDLLFYCFQHLCYSSSEFRLRRAFPSCTLGIHAARAGAKFAMPSHGDTVDKDSFAVLAFGS